MNPKYPVYIISKGRWDSRMTSKALDEMNVPYRIVVEPQEYERYSEHIPSEKILTLPFSNLGQGSIPARNWVWEHSIVEGHKRHWILDDNIRRFQALNNNRFYTCRDGSTFRIIEQFVDRYKNVAQAGMQYFMFTPRKVKKAPVSFNTRIYSIILNRNELIYRWRGRYNEDTDLSLRILKAGWVTCLFNCYIADKQTTLTMKGGNTDELYGKTNDRYEFALSLKRQHPEHVEIVRKYNRWHHKVDYRPFRKNKLVKIEGLDVTSQNLHNALVFNKTEGYED